MAIARSYLLQTRDKKLSLVDYPEVTMVVTATHLSVFRTEGSVVMKNTAGSTTVSRAYQQVVSRMNNYNIEEK